MHPPAKLCYFCGVHNFVDDDDENGVYRDDHDNCSYDGEHVHDHQNVVHDPLGKLFEIHNLTLTRRPSRKITALSYSCTT